MFNLNLRKLRKEKGVTQKVIADYLNLSREAYSMYETEKRQMNYSTLFMLADYFDVSIDHLLGREEYVKDSEIPLLKEFRRLDERGKAVVKAIIRTELEGAKKQIEIHPAV